MASQHSSKTDAIESTYHSPFDELVYRALVFARSNKETPLYHVAGVNGGPWAPRKALCESHRKHGGKCFYCKKVVPNGQATLDHVEPAVLGGRSHLPNLVIACGPCNARKGHTPIDAFNPEAGKEWLEALLKQIQERLNGITAFSPPPPSRAEEGGP